MINPKTVQALFERVLRGAMERGVDRLSLYEIEKAFEPFKDHILVQPDTLEMMQAQADWQRVLNNHANEFRLIKENDNEE